MSTVSKSNLSARASDLHDREKKPQEISAYIAEGKIPAEVDLTQHPEKSIEARGCTFLMLSTTVDRRVHFVCRAYGEGCRINQRCQDRSGDVSRVISHRLLLIQTREDSVDELVNTAAKQLSTANSFVTSKAKL